MKIYHNPRCKKSRETLQLIKDKGIDPKVIRYLETPPSEKEIRDMLKKLHISPKELVRTSEPAYKENFAGREISDDSLIKAMVDNPILIQRPIVVEGDEAVLGRPPENVYKLLK